MKKMMNAMLITSILANCSIMPFNVNATEIQATVTQISEAEEINGISEKLKNDIEAGLDKIDVTMWCVFKYDHKSIIAESKAAATEYEATLNTSVYTAEQINQMVGEYKNTFTENKYHEADLMMQKEVCDIIGIDVSEAEFNDARLICSLTPEQIFKIAGTKYLKGEVIEQSEFVSGDELGYEHFDVSESLTVKEVQAIFNKFFEENNMDAKCVTSINYPIEYPSLVIEYVIETNTITGPQIVEFAEKNSIDRTLFTVAPIENGVPMIRYDVGVNVHGDANCDGKTTVADSVAILQHIANRDKYGLSSQGLINADVDDEAGVTANDARALQEWDANM